MKNLDEVVRLKFNSYNDACAVREKIDRRMREVGFCRLSDIIKMAQFCIPDLDATKVGYTGCYFANEITIRRYADDFWIMKLPHLESFERKE